MLITTNSRMYNFRIFAPIYIFYASLPPPLYEAYLLPPCKCLHFSPRLLRYPASYNTTIPLLLNVILPYNAEEYLIQRRGTNTLMFQAKQFLVLLTNHNQPANTIINGFFRLATPANLKITIILARHKTLHLFLDGTPIAPLLPPHWNRKANLAMVRLILDLSFLPHS